MAAKCPRLYNSLNVKSENEDKKKMFPAARSSIYNRWMLPLSLIYVPVESGMGLTLRRPDLNQIRFGFDNYKIRLPCGDSYVES